MPSARAVLVLGMHRSGTSALARGLNALGVDLGNDFLVAQPENPTGYWEDKNLVALDDRVLDTLGLKWDGVSRVERSEFGSRRVRALRRETVRYCRRTFSAAPIWGFKDPRALRILPFWRGVLEDCGVQESHLVVIRNPRSVAASLFERQKMEPDLAYRLWLIHMVPFFGELLDRELVVVDYDLLMQDPRLQMRRISERLRTPVDGNAATVDQFVADFLDKQLRHSAFSLSDLDDRTPAARLTRDVYHQLYELARDRRTATAATFASTWEKVAEDLARLIPLGPARRRWWGFR